MKFISLPGQVLLLFAVVRSGRVNYASNLLKHVCNMLFGADTEFVMASEWLVSGGE